MSVRFPPPIAPNEPISIVAPAGIPRSNKRNKGVAWFESFFKIVVHEHVKAKKGYFAGDDDQRREDFQRAIDSEETKGIVAVRGGYGVSRIMDELRFESLEKNPKWIVGSSDMTALLVTLYAKQKLATIHGPMVAGVSHTDSRDLHQLMDLLQGKKWRPPTDLKALVAGRAEGPLIGGNLTMLAHIAGTLSPDFTDGAILLLEDVAERPYRLDRCLTQLKRAHFLENIAGIVLGNFTNCDPGKDGMTWQEVMEENLKPLGVPIAAGYPAAHGKRNAPFIHGATVSLKAESDRVELGIM